MGSQHDAARVCCSAPCLQSDAYSTSWLSIDISCPQGAQQQTRRLSIDGMDGQ